jgi:hypothetical protein
MELTPDQLEAEVRSQFNRTRGRLAGLIESWGLPERQERGMIATMKSLSYDAENSIVDLLKQ